MRSNIVQNNSSVGISSQVAKVARKLAGKGGSEEDGKAPKEKGTVMVMTLLEGGTNSRQKAWLKVCFCMFLIRRTHPSSASFQGQLLLCRVASFLTSTLP